MNAETIASKQAIVDEISGKFNEASSAVLVEYRGLTVEEVTELRRNLRAENAELKVYKNNLVKRATDGTDYADLADSLKGPNAIAFGKGEATAPARIVADFAKKHDKLVIKASCLEGKVLDTDATIAVSKLPGKQGMYSMLLGCLQAPMSKLARTLQAMVDAQGAPAEETAE